MKLLPIILFALLLSSCEASNFDADRRQIVAKDVIHYKLGRVKDYDVVSFKEDTLKSWTDTSIKNPILYALQVTYVDSTGKPQVKKGMVIFAPDGKSVLDSRIEEENQ